MPRVSVARESVGYRLDHSCHTDKHKDITDDYSRAAPGSYRVERAMTAMTLKSPTAPAKTTLTSAFVCLASVVLEVRQ